MIEPQRRPVVGNRIGPNLATHRVPSLVADESQDEATSLGGAVMIAPPQKRLRRNFPDRNGRSPGLSEGTLRILALTLVAYLDDLPPLLVVEEPENSIHPQAIDTILQSLRSCYDQQVWVSTHSPIVLAGGQVSELMISRLDRRGAATVIPGSEHPRLSSNEIERLFMEWLAFGPQDPLDDLAPAL